MNDDTAIDGVRRFADLGDDCGWNLDASLDADRLEASGAAPGARRSTDVHPS